MEECMRECMKKLALWFTNTFKPIMTHDELEPMMATLGFVGLPPTPPPLLPSNGSPVAWKEYVYSAGGSRLSVETTPPKPRLPYPRIDGLHIYTYRAFIDAVNFYLDMSEISDLFHIRGMPLHRVHDRNRKWRRMEEDESIFVYREGTLDQATYNLYHFDKNIGTNNSGNGCNAIIRNKVNNAPVSSVVSLKDVIVI
ncbi:hypothetical protein ACB098_07G167500 [Castanea mollissima]